MSKLSVNELTDETGSGAPSFPNGMSVTGAALTDPEITGGIYLGGTGSANKLDDYEEGTWTPAFHVDRSGGPNPGGNAVYDGYYTKIGSLVTCYASLNFDSSESIDENDFFELSGKPFSFSSSYNNNYYGLGTLAKYQAASNNKNAWGIVGLSFENILIKIIFTSGSNLQYNDSDDFGNVDGEIGITFTYITDS